MYSVIQPIISVNCYNLERQVLSPNNSEKILTFINLCNKGNQKSILNYCLKNKELILNFLDFMPFSVFLNLYQNYGFLANKMNDNIINRYINISHNRLYINHANNERKSDFIKLTNQLNQYYNFTEKVVQKRFSKINKYLFGLIKDDDFRNIVFGANIVLTLSNRDKYKNFPEKEVLYTFYTKGKLQIYNMKGVDLYRINDKSFLIKKDNINFLLSYCNDPFELLISKEECFIDTNGIYCTPKFYQKLENNYIEPLSYNKFKIEKKIINPKIILPTHRTKNINHIIFNIKNCYICKKIYDTDIHFDDYKSMCFECGYHNYLKREEMAELTNIKVFITGIRHKIGYQAVLKLLRCGATVFGSTRYPNAAWYNYSQEIDFNEWKNRLTIIKCDFLQMDRVMQMINFVIEQKPHVIINNACQTVRPTIQYKQNIHKLENLLDKISIKDKQNCKNLIEQKDSFTFNNKKWNENTSIIIKEECIELDRFGDVKDNLTRKQSSWTKKMEEIDPTEILEVNIINQIVPTLIVNQIKPNMEKPAFIINVTAIEGQFKYNKTGNHPHTNMCKSGINMMIKTMADTKEKDYYYYAIDPGFVSGVQVSEQRCPINAKDGGSRIIHPIISYFNGNVCKDLKYKNYKTCPW